MKFEIKGSQYADPAIRVAEIVEQVREALWHAARNGGLIPMGSVEIDLCAQAESRRFAEARDDAR